jgi:hypothetical protein
MQLASALLHSPRHPGAGPSSQRRPGRGLFQFRITNVCINLIVKIAPVRIHLFNETELPVPMPFLQELLTPDGFLHEREVRIPRERLGLVFFAITIKAFVLVIANPQ